LGEDIVKPWRYAALPIVMLASHSLAENWIGITGKIEGVRFRQTVDEDSIRRGKDGLVYFEMNDAALGKFDDAADCRKRVIYTLKSGLGDDPDWRSNGIPAEPDSLGEAELQYVCANVGSRRQPKA
jgi:hypothetical protein